MFGCTYRKRRERIRKRKEKYFPLGVFGYREEWKEKKKRYISFVCFANGRERENVCFYLYALIYISNWHISILFCLVCKHKNKNRKDMSFVFIRFKMKKHFTISPTKIESNMKHYLPYSAFLTKGPHAFLQCFNWTFLIDGAGIPETTLGFYRFQKCIKLFGQLVYLEWREKGTLRGIGSSKGW